MVQVVCSVAVLFLSVGRVALRVAPAVRRPPMDSVQVVATPVRVVLRAHAGPCIRPVLDSPRVVPADDPAVRAVLEGGLVLARRVREASEHVRVVRAEPPVVLRRWVRRRARHVRADQRVVGVSSTPRAKKAR